MAFLLFTALFAFISLSHSLLIHINDSRPRCYEKTLIQEDMLQLDYIISSGTEERLSLELTKEPSHEVVFHLDNNQTGRWDSQLLSQGNYKLCFIPADSNSYYISFGFVSYSETGLVKGLAQDKEVKLIGLGIDRVKSAFQDFEIKLKNIVDRRSSHNKILNDIVYSIKQLTFVKIGIIALISVLQVFFIRKFFGPDKRVTKVSGANKNESL